MLAHARPQRSCRQPHGTIARYVAGCSCFECCEAWRIYQALRKDGPGMADGDAAREIIARLRRRGYTRRAIAEGSGLSYGGVRAIENGGSRNVHADTLEALRAFRTAPPTSSVWVPADRTIALIGRLHASGVPKREIARRLGMAPHSSLPGSRPQAHCFARTAAAVEQIALECGVIKRSVDEEKVLDLHADGLCAEAIAELAQTTQRSVHRVLARQGPVA